MMIVIGTRRPSLLKEENGFPYSIHFTENSAENSDTNHHSLVFGKGDREMNIANTRDPEQCSNRQVAIGAEHL
jgi:hypothetical protein